MTYNNTGTMGAQDGDIQIKLKPDHAPTADYVRTLREELPARFPGVTFSFLPADIISQILNFGICAGADRLADPRPRSHRQLRLCRNAAAPLRHVPGLVDARIPAIAQRSRFQCRCRPHARAICRRHRTLDVTNSLVVNLAGSSQVAPTYWLNPVNGVSYPIVMQTPQSSIDSLSALRSLPITATGAPSQTMGAIADVNRVNRPAVISQYNIQPMIQIYGTTQGRDLGAVAADVQKIMNDTAKDAPKGAQVVLLGQVRTMNSAFSGLLFGLLGAIVLIYLLIVVNFQSWGDPFVIVLPHCCRRRSPASSGRCSRNRHDAFGASSYRRDHVHGRCHREQRACHQLCTGAPCGIGRSDRGRRSRSRLRPIPPGIDDRACHDHRDGADGTWAWRGWRAERPARSRRGRCELIFATIATLMFVPVVFSIVHGRDSKRHAPAHRNPSCRP